MASGGRGMGLFAGIPRPRGVGVAGIGMDPHLCGAHPLFALTLLQKPPFSPLPRAMISGIISRS